MRNKKLGMIVAVGLMAALCYVGNYLEIRIPVGDTATRIHFGNTVCLLAGLLFGGVPGGLAAGIGAGLYDLFNPLYISSAPFTFLAKFAMGFICGYIAKSPKKLVNQTVHITISAIIGQVTYLILYIGKSFLSDLLLGAAVGTAVTNSATKLFASTTNAIIAVVVSVPLYLALQKPLKTTYFRDLLEDRKAREVKWYAKLGVIALFIAVCALAIWVYVVNKK